MIGKDYLELRMSFYDNAKQPRSSQAISVGIYFDFIRQGNWRSHVDPVRQTDVKQLRTNLKMKVPCVIPSGIFLDGRRDDQIFGEFTGIIVLDLDRKDNEGIDFDAVSLDASLMKSTLAVHQSISGDGLAIFVLADRWQSNTYKVMRTFYEAMLGVNLDKATSNLARLRYVSYDPYIRINYDAVPMVIPEPVSKIAHQKPEYNRSNLIRNNNSDDFVRVLAETVISNGDDPTADYSDWIKIGYAVAGEYGAAGSDLFHLISKNHPNYTHEETERVFRNMVRSGESRSSKGTLIYILSKYQ